MQHITAVSQVDSLLAKYRQSELFTHANDSALIYPYYATISPSFLLELISHPSFVCYINFILMSLLTSLVVLIWCEHLNFVVVSCFLFYLQVFLFFYSILTAIATVFPCAVNDRCRWKRAKCAPNTTLYLAILFCFANMCSSVSFMVFAWVFLSRFQEVVFFFNRIRFMHIAHTHAFFLQIQENSQSALIMHYNTIRSSWFILF